MLFYSIWLDCKITKIHHAGFWQILPYPVYQNLPDEHGSAAVLRSCSCHANIASSGAQFVRSSSTSKEMMLWCTGAVQRVPKGRWWLIEVRTRVCQNLCSKPVLDLPDYFILLFWFCACLFRLDCKHKWLTLVLADSMPVDHAPEFIARPWSRRPKRIPTRS